MTGASPEAAGAEVETAISRLFTYGALADKYDGRVHGAPLRGLALGLHEPVGVVGVVCPDEAPLLSLVSLMAPLVAMGNRVVIVPSERHPLAATDFCQVLESSDVPDGVVNLVTGPARDLLVTLAAHDDVDAVWAFGAAELSEAAERLSAGNLKRTLTDDGRLTDWFDPAASEGEILLRHAVEVKSVWIPYGV
ncbi:Betaine aldehyde dehydrogenase [Methylobrevis pamukkalensis]|uniref:Betaine aldehyde dehydrogenase n=1 Tax=Methylobrevis pamukkalensis TaxID=1439726 RepID=A0A1E3H325_9HYPH|nr:Betaine aldehyde dehydrogenase [Methylobrevis pamukkalensis]